MATDINGYNLETGQAGLVGSCAVVLPWQQQVGLEDGTGSFVSPCLSYAPSTNPPGGPGPVLGCTDPTASNYNSLATMEDGSCVYSSPHAYLRIISLGIGVNSNASVVTPTQTYTSTVTPRNFSPQYQTIADISAGIVCTISEAGGATETQTYSLNPSTYYTIYRLPFNTANNTQSMWLVEDYPNTILSQSGFNARLLSATSLFTTSLTGPFASGSFTSSYPGTVSVDTGAVAGSGTITFTEQTTGQTSTLPIVQYAGVTVILLLKSTLNTASGSLVPVIIYGPNI